MKQLSTQPDLDFLKIDLMLFEHVENILVILMCQFLKVWFSNAVPTVISINNGRK